jgi:large subunit ribosomal protein L10
VDRAEKKAAIETLNGVFKASNVVVVAHYSGLTVAQMQHCAGRCGQPARR